MTYIELLLVAHDKKTKPIVEAFDKEIQPIINKLVKKYGKDKTRLVYEAFMVVFD